MVRCPSVCPPVTHPSTGRFIVELVSIWEGTRMVTSSDFRWRVLACQGRVYCTTHSIHMCGCPYTAIQKSKSSGWLANCVIQMKRKKQHKLKAHSNNIRTDGAEREWMESKTQIRIWIDALSTSIKRSWTSTKSRVGFKYNSHGHQMRTKYIPDWPGIKPIMISWISNRPKWTPNSTQLDAELTPNLQNQSRSDPEILFSVLHFLFERSCTGLYGKICRRRLLCSHLSVSYVLILSVPTHHGHFKSFQFYHPWPKIKGF